MNYDTGRIGSWMALLTSIMLVMTVSGLAGDSGANCHCCGLSDSTNPLEVVKAKEFILTDAKGRAVGGMRTNDGKSSVYLKDNAGNVRIELEVSNIDSLQHVAMKDSDGNLRWLASLDKLGSPEFTMFGDGDILGRGGSVFVDFESGGIPRIDLVGPGAGWHRGRLSFLAGDGCPPSIQASQNSTVIDEWPVLGQPTPQRR